MASSPAAATGPTEEFRYPGNRLGLPADGSGSVASWGRRVLALIVDWLIAGLIASVLTGRPMWAGGNSYSLTHSAIFFFVTAVLTALLGGTIGHRICDLRVAVVRDQKVHTVPPGILPSVVRALLILLVIPAVVFDRDRRGLHDLAAKTIVVRR
ncbi:RDD family protein [Kribbella sp. NPDC048915]|uniref:RDD family protein n=1 Tax=Kribbella sp. NPDC048915 TaxID=3155148 RepID=UPI0033F82E88